jgi:PAS domain S-box-containing protein
MNSKEHRNEPEADALRKEIEALERRRDDLAAQRDKFLDLYDNAPDLCASVDLTDGTIRTINDTMLRELGWERDEIIGSPIVRFVHPDDHQHIFAGIVSLIEGAEDVQDVEVRATRRDGSLFPIALNVTARRDEAGTPLYSRGIARDISDQKRTEVALASSEARMRSLTESFNVVPWTVSREERPAAEGQNATEELKLEDYVPEYIGPQFEKVLGYPISRWYEPGFWSSLIHPDDLPRPFNVETEHDSDLVFFRDEFRMIAADGRSVPVLTLTTATTIEGRRVLSGVIVDLTEIKAAEQAQKVFMRELGHRVKNTFASVQSVLEQTLSTAGDIEAFLTTFCRRIDALADIHHAMARSDWTDIDVPTLVESALAAYGEAPRVIMAGESIRVPLEVGRVLGMVLHELATNAAKHGSLSSREGKVSVHWRHEDRKDAPALVLEWAESGGPPVSHSGGHGYGMRIIEDLVPYELGGRANVTFAERGLCCNIEIPLASVDAGSDQVEEAP